MSKETIIKTSSYTESFPEVSMKLKVAYKTPNWNTTEAIKTLTFEDALYDGGFVSINGGKSYALAYNFLFHKLKREAI